MAAYYNEWEPYAAQWLRNLIAAGHIAPGDVDERSIVDVHPDDLRGYEQCHFFAGIGGWSLALRMAGWDDARPVWTGSCPCQPFSVAGQQKAQADERHLWPEWFRLIRESCPGIIFGEQVTGAIAKGWWDDAADDLERQGYAVAAHVLPACSIGAPHKRDRLWFMADTHQQGPQGRNGAELRKRAGEQSAGPGGAYVADSQSQRCNHGDDGKLLGQTAGEINAPSSSGGTVCGLEAGRWESEPGVGRVAHGIPARVGKLRAYGNAIVPQVAAEFIKAAM